MPGLSTTGAAASSAVPQQAFQQEKKPSFFTKGVRIWQLVVEVVFKEMGAIAWSTLNMAKYAIKRDWHGLNPKVPTVVNRADSVAKVVIFIHGSGGNQSCFFPMAKKMNNAGIGNLYAIKLNPTDRDPVPIESLAKRVDAVSKQCFEKGAKRVEVALVGHSLGALVATKYVWRGGKSLNVRVNLVVSCAGRLKYVPNKFAWFCQDVRPEIDKTYESIQKAPEKAVLYTVWGDKDGVVLRESAHIQADLTKQLTVKGYGHGGVIYSDEVHEKVIDSIQGWQKEGT